ncbi:acyltransferase [Escherichia coli]|nr:acyltransferase [Escherichia coli]MDB7244521.1 acyltransferase [Escherichia coli]MDB8032684.1 acyltransferase [Escherichia coli]
MNKIYSLQVFRGLAAVMVLLAHSNIMLNKSLFSGSFIPGYIGVDFFFVLSGFIIMLTCKKSIGSGEISGYIRKRVLRVFPPYIIYTVLAFIVSYAYEQFTGTRLIYWIYINAQNFFQSISLYPFSADKTRLPILPVAWTLTHEMLFYILFASLFFIKNKSGILLIAAAWIALIVAAPVMKVSGSNYLLDTFLSSRNLEFIMGCAMAYFASNYVDWKISVSALICGLGMLVIAWSNTLSGYSITTLSDWAVYGIPFALIIFGATRLERFIHNKEGKVFRFLVYLGDASYSIYLVHFIVIMVCKRTINDLGMEYGYMEFWLTSAIALVVSLAMYELIEEPMIRWFNRAKAHPLTAS